RDLYVTGVQTCALPIYQVLHDLALEHPTEEPETMERCLRTVGGGELAVEVPGADEAIEDLGLGAEARGGPCGFEGADHVGCGAEIGRASCRERGWGWGL